MKKQVYISPLTEVTAYSSMSSIMITSIGMGGSALPGEPGKQAPKAPYDPEVF